MCSFVSVLKCLRRFIFSNRVFRVEALCSEINNVPEEYFISILNIDGKLKTTSTSSFEDHIKWRVHTVSQLRRLQSKKLPITKYSDFYLVRIVSLLLISEKILKIYSQTIYTNRTAYRVERTVSSLLVLTTLFPVVGLRNSVATGDWMTLTCF